MSRNWVVVLFVGSLIACAAIVTAYENHRWSSEVASVTQENDVLTAELAQAEGLAEIQRSRLTRARAVAATKTKQVATLERRVDSLSSELVATESQLSSTQQELDAASAQAPLETAAPATEPPATAAPSSACHSSYEGQCLDPTASDYDCAGGEGNGPKYTGRVVVVGPDEYGLDSNRDGVGCE